MSVIREVKVDVTIGKYQIRPYPNSLCWELFELRKNKKSDEEEWASMGCYPSTFGYALAKVLEHLLKDEEGTYGLDEAMTIADKHYNNLMQIAVDYNKEADKVVIRNAG